MIVQPDLTGEVFGRWLVVSGAGKDRFRNLCWLCQCECGTMSVVRGVYLKDGRSKSCGCYKDETTRAISYKHGHSNTRKKTTTEYISWLGMKHRCYCKSNKAYHHYGGRGITVSEKWVNSFSNFIDDMGLKPSKEYSLDRINVDGNYEPGNCRWATKKEQSNNKRTSVLITVAWYTKTQSEWAQILGVNASRIQWKAKSVGHSEAVAYYFSQVKEYE